MSMTKQCAKDIKKMAVPEIEARYAKYSEQLSKEMNMAIRDSLLTRMKMCRSELVDRKARSAK